MLTETDRAANPPNGGEESNEKVHSRAAQTYHRLRELIVYGQLAPGSRIIEADIADRMDVSRTPVRAALQRLEQEGYIVSGNAEQRWRPRVAPLTREDSIELLFIIGEIEGLAGWFAAKLEGEAHASLVHELHCLNEELRNAAAEKRPAADQYYDLDQAFHNAYVDAGAGPRLRSLHDAIKPQAERYIRVYVSALTMEIETSILEHEEIARTIEQRDAKGAQEAVRQNWRGAVERLASVIEWVGERGSW